MNGGPQAGFWNAMAELAAGAEEGASLVATRNLSDIYSIFKCIQAFFRFAKKLFQENLLC